MIPTPAEIADDMNADMRDTHTRMLVFMFYWCNRALIAEGKSGLFSESTVNSCQEK